MICALVLAALLAGAAPPAREIAGLWRTPVDGGSTVRIGTCGEAVCGWGVSSPRLRAFPDQKDVRNRDPAQRGRLIAGLLFLKLRPLGPGRWGDGWVYNPEDGGTYKGTVELKPDGRLSLRGCIVAPLCQTQTWTRIR
ncbi:MAG: DUF2147 domain-containing protein [Caulobacteraceae bacterium]